MSARFILRRSLRGAPLALAGLFLLDSVLWMGTPAVSAQESPYAVAVEEDWELVVANPDSNSTGPQTSCTISPHSDLDGDYATFELNHQSLPQFAAGGMQLLTWSGETFTGGHKFPRSDTMKTQNEQVTWTQSMRLSSGQLNFEVTDGHSTTWGEFGEQGYLRCSLPTQLSSLNNYSPQVTVQNSGVTFAGNRVKSLKLKRVRMIMSNGVVLEDDTVRVVHETQ